MLRGRFFMAVSLCALLCVLAPVASLAQTTAQITGRVTDASGAVVPGVDVTLTNLDTGVARFAVTNESGAYAFPSLSPGPYRLQAALQGFRTFAQTDIVLQVGGNVVIDPALEAGQLTETVEVRGGASQLQVELRAMAVSEVVEGERILELPLAARDATSLITLSGAAVDVGAGAIGGTMTTGTAISVAGGQRMGVLYTLDGAMHNNRWFEGNMPTPFPDALAEFRVSTERAGSAERPVVGGDSEPDHPIGHQRFSRRRVPVRAQRRAQRPSGDRTRTRSAEAQPAGRHPRRPAHAQPPVLLRGLPKHHRAIGALVHVVDRADSRHARR